MKLKFKAKILLPFLIATLVSCTSLSPGTEKVSEKETSTKTVVYNKTIRETAYGKVEGMEINENKALAWKGVPFAKAPEGELRWKAPVNPDSWTDVLDATKSGNVEIQATPQGVKGSEDCLNLDIYRPNTTDKNLPVFLFIHGGNNQSGASDAINPEKFVVNANVVVVSINYRLGLLGFNNLPALKTGDKFEDSGNYALLDIAKSLDWVKENIENFGGQADNITVTGFSAGGRDVMAMLISPVFKDKFQKAISFSGGMTLANYSESQELFAEAIAPLVVEDKIKASEDEAFEWLMSPKEEVRDYLYNLSADRLAKLMTNAGIRMGVFPHLFNDGTVLPTDGYSTKNYNNVPLIMVTGSNEFSLFGRFDKLFAGIKEENLLDNSDTAKSYSYVYDYGNRLYELFNAQESAERMFDAYKAPIYTVDFDWGANEDVYDERTRKVFGALHGIWMPFLMDGIQGPAVLVAESLKNDGTKDLTDKFTKYIANFMKTGNPNSEGLVEWKAWEAVDSGPTQLSLDADNEKAIIMMTNKRASYDDILNDMENDNRISPELKSKMIKEVLNGRWFSRKLDVYFENDNEWVQVY